MTTTNFTPLLPFLAIVPFQPRVQPRRHCFRLDGELQYSSNKVLLWPQTMTYGSSRSVSMWPTPNLLMSMINSLRPTMTRPWAHLSIHRMFFPSSTWRIATLSSNLYLPTHCGHQTPPTCSSCRIHPLRSDNLSVLSRFLSKWNKSHYKAGQTPLALYDLCLRCDSKMNNCWVGWGETWTHNAQQPAMCSRCMEELWRGSRNCSCPIHH